MFLTPDRLRSALERVQADTPQVRVMEGDYGKLLAVVVSPSFEGMDDGKRQNLVWEQIIKNLTDDEQSQVEFIFTNAPSEEDAAAPSS